jgi:hypothetical protein
MHVVDACGGRAVAAFPVIAPEGQQVWAASARFRTGTNDLQ